ncbi:alginate export family protein [uncultured Bacteroides sp.]|uniref:alginate export family protein n=1 Tax=uncultured Bacteroides sp. TaxID=162156 RepID=UPI002AA6ED7D|nr:alginate export family protein [uncultured Bacteroides sp.]
MNWFLKSKTDKMIVGIALLLSATTEVMAQELSINAELRPRAEYRSGYSTPITDAVSPGGFILQRTRLGFEFKNAYMKTHLTLQDARTFGESAITSEPAASSGALSIYEAWAEVVLIPGGTVKIGRQTLAYDDNRLFSASNWSNTGKAHDAVVFKYELDNNFTGHLGFAYNNDKAISKETVYSGVATYRYMGYLWISKSLSTGLSLSAIMLDEGMQKTSTDNSGNITYSTKVDMYHRYTAGGNLKFLTPSCPFNFLATAYFQFGKTTATKDLNASLLALKANYTFRPAITATAGIDLYSGDEGKSATKSKTFNWLYGGPHSFNGSMDYWTASLPTTGLMDTHVQVAGKLTPKFAYELRYHVFNTAKEMEYSNEKQGKSLGSELDLKLSYKMNSSVAVEGGWSTYFLSDNSRYLKLKSADAKSRTPNWAYISLTIRPEVFKIKL